MEEIYKLLREARTAVESAKDEYLGNPDIDYTFDSALFDDITDAIDNLENEADGTNDMDEEG